MADYNQPDFVEKRVRYFDGQFLKDQDFVDEQKYFIDRQRRYTRFLNVSGIVDGLAVKVKPGTTDLVTVDPGTALDNKGRQIVLSDLGPETDRQVPLNSLRGATADLVITYNEEGSDQAQAGSAGFTRFYEKPRLLTVPSGQTAPDGAVTLARLTINGTGGVEVNNTVRVYAGMRLPYDGAAPGQGPALRAGSAGRLDLTGSLSITDALILNDNLVQLRGRADTNHGIGWYGTNKPFAGVTPDGPVVFGYLGGALGTSVGGQKIALTWNKDGNVGIGTPSPDNKLTITGAQQGTEANITGNVANNALNIEANYAADNYVPGIVWTTNDNNATKPKAGIWASEHATGSRLYLGTSNNYGSGITNKAIIIHESGNVGIGATTPKGFQVALPESSKGNTAPGPGVTIAGGPDGNAGIELRNNGSGTPYIDFAQDGTKADYDARIRLTAPGQLAIEGAKVGIGIASPDRQVHVEGGELRVRASHNNTTADIGTFYAQNLTQGIGVGYNRIEAIGSNANQDILIIPKGTGNVGIGTTSPGYELTISGTSTHLQLRRESTETTGGKQVFLELFQDDPSPAKVPEVNPSIRFHHSNRFWHRLEARSNGFHFKEGYLPGDGYVSVYTGGAFVSGGDLAVPGGVETLRMLRGIIASDGTVFVGSGFTVSRPSTGIYDITFTQAFPSVPGASATQIFGSLNSGTADPSSAGGDTRDNAVIAHLSANKLRVKTGDNTGAVSNRYFSFIVIGPR